MKADILINFKFYRGYMVFIHAEANILVHRMPKYLFSDHKDCL